MAGLVKLRVLLVSRKCSGHTYVRLGCHRQTRVTIMACLLRYAFWSGETQVTASKKKASFPFLLTFQQISGTRGLMMIQSVNCKYIIIILPVGSHGGLWWSCQSQAE